VPHASPVVRKFARELGVPLEEVRGTGPKGRITQDDVQAFVKGVMTGRKRRPGAAPRRPPRQRGRRAALGLLPWPKVDFAKFGPIERQAAVAHQEDQRRQPAPQLGDDPARHQPRRRRHHRAGGLPRATEQGEREGGVKVTMLAFLIKACVAALRSSRSSTARWKANRWSTSATSTSGFAADTPNGLVVPVVKDADQKGVYADQPGNGELAEGARRQARPRRHERGCFTISSRWAASAARYFTPIINAPRWRSWACAEPDASRSGTARPSSRA
jgi:pyruvate dehydrogenase E2 component (dihydrolipoamide acetyltransferase)